MSKRKVNRERPRPLGALAGWLGAGIPVLLICALAAGLLGAIAGGWLSFSQGLPKIPDLRAYRPKTVSTFYAEDGTVIGIFYREKRFPVLLDSMPAHVINAFLAAEDARFFSHVGVDWIGVVRAFVKNVKMGNFAQGGSTITQQVTRNFLLTKEKKLSRKIREALLAFRLEKTLTKREILELYLNEIYLGKGAYGVEAAARTYFGKTTANLTIAEAAMLAGLVSNPSKYSPHRNLTASRARQTIVLDNMVRNGFISENEYARARKQVPRFREELPNTYQRAPYFAEAVRQYIATKYGEDRLYNEGLRVWTTCDLDLQRKASRALRDGAFAWEKRQHRPTGIVRRLKSSEARSFVSAPAKRSLKVGETVEAVVIKNNTPRKRTKKNQDDHVQDCTMALKGGERFQVRLESPTRYKPHDLLQFKVVEANEARITLQPLKLPPVEGAVVCIENGTGYVRALVGGLDFERSRFNRAMKALRQPGSAFKPFVYTAALEAGRYGPNTVVVDEPIAVFVDPREQEWIPSNSDGSFLGPITLRQALAHSRNIAAVKLIMDVGVDTAIKTAHDMGIESRLGKNLSLALGASEVTPLELTSAYTVFPNMGMRVAPVLVKKVVDRFGNVLEDNTMAPLNISEVVRRDPTRLLTRGRAEQPYFGRPRIPRQPARESYDQSRVASPRGSAATWEIESILSGAFHSRRVQRRPEARRVLTSQTAYLLLSMLRETCVSGTGARVSRLGRKDLAGKTGTTDDCTDAWFVGFNPAYTTGVWIGYDTKVSLGRKEYGNVAALPIWMAFMKGALRNVPSSGYPVPAGIVFWDLNAPPNTVRAEDLVQAGPDLPPNPETKPVCPVDMGLMPVSHEGDPFTGQPVPVRAPFSFQADQSLWGSGLDSPTYPGMVRVLSPRGETLGHAYLSMDEKGRTTLYRDDIYEMANQQGYRQEPPIRSLPPGWAQTVPPTGSMPSGQQFLGPGMSRFPPDPRSPYFQPHQGGWN